MGIGTGSKARYDAIREVTSRTPRKIESIKGEDGKELKISDFFGINTFDQNKMKERLPRDIFNKLQKTIETGQPIDKEISNSVAQAVRDWAVERGVTHFCHWFQPQTGSTAEKHDALLGFDEQHMPLEKLSGSQLLQSEPDASSFPSGGMRTTFEARGYTAWDPSSPIFIMESTNSKTLCIPSVFISYTGDALDKKTGLLRSIETLSQKSVELLHLIGETNAKRVVPTLGTEQEYFLIDRAFASLRPDLTMSGRTLLGSRPPRGQQLEDHYFGSIPTRVQAFMAEVERELYKVGVPVKTRHNEVAPSQFETAPIFEEANVATDHNQLTMAILRKVARRHQFEAFMHEKPFAELNGNGKHCNWSMMITASGTDLEGSNLLEPGKTPYQNLRFLLFLAATLHGVHKHGGLLRAGIATHGNDHRLGANEAPPAIISVFMGEHLTTILDEIEKGVDHHDNSDEMVLRLGVSKLPEVAKDNTDRNRTSPFAFTGNKFEFRAVGSSNSPAFPMTLLNASVADGISEITSRLKEKLKAQKSLDAAILEVLRDSIRDTKAIRFEGNNYSDEWVRDAESRGLPNLRKTPESLAQLVSEKSKSLLTSLKIFSNDEITARYNVQIDRYVKNLLIEAEMLEDLTKSQVLPAAYAYHTQLSSGAVAAKSAGASIPQLEPLSELSSLIGTLQDRVKKLRTQITEVDREEDEPKKAELLAGPVSVEMESVRETCDQLEEIVADDFWPLPKYREMLFLS